MSKSMVEKYEQMLAQDPTSTVFVELARAYLERGDSEKAITLCQQGCAHHPNSVVGRVLWGKGLINVGRAAEAMKQFDLATNIDKDNAHAYNLIGEVLLRKGLYRSALPILRKAAQLQPNDGRITQWLEQTRTALSGGPAPVLYDNTSVDTRPLDERTGLPVDEAPSAPVPPAIAPVTTFAVPAIAPMTLAPNGTLVPSLSDGGDVAEPTVIMQAYVPEKEREKAIAALTEQSVTTEIPTQQSRVLAQYAPPSGPRPGPPVLTEEDEPAFRPPAPSDGVVVSPVRPSQQDLPVVMGQVDAPQDPFAPFAQQPLPESNETVRGLTSTFDALEQSAPQAAPLPFIAPVITPLATHASVDGPPVLLPVPDASQPSVAVSPNAGVAPRPSGNGLLGGGLLDDIPDEGPPSVELAPRAEYSSQATEAIAKEYEAELRAKLEANTKKQTFLQRHGLKLAIAAGVLVIVGGGGGAFLRTRYQNDGKNLAETLAQGRAAVNADTKEQYLAGLQSLGQAITMDDGSTEAWAWSAYAHAMLYAEHGGNDANRNAALTAVSKPNVRSSFADLAAVVDYLTADPANVTAARQQLLGSTLEQSAVLTQAGKVLLADKKYDEAFKKLSRALELNNKNERTLVLLGDYYLALGDFEAAVNVLEGTAEQLSKYHPQRVMDLAEARLEMGRDPAAALADLESLKGNATVPPASVGRYTLLMGRALSANGKHDEALKTLAEGLVAHGDLAFAYQMGLGQAYRNSGQMDRAQKAFEEARRLDPKSEDAKEGFGRVLLARSREKELLDQLKPDPDAKRVSLVRGIALARLGDFKKARGELAKTTINGKYPAEAAVYLAIADASEEQGDKPVQLLEKLASQTKRHKATVQIALARIYMQRNMLDKARAQLEDASKDPQDYEANAQLAELLLNAGVPFEVALEPLTRAVDRNGSHAPARHLLARTYTAMGRYADAIKQVDAWTLDNPSLDLGWKDTAFVYFHAGRTKDAEAAIAKGVRGDSDDVEGWRLKAQILFARADAKNAFTALERANKLNPKDAETFCEIGNAYVRQGNYDVAMKAYEAARREDPKSPCGQIGPHHAKPSARGGKPTPHDELVGLVKSSLNSWDKGFAQATLARVMVEEHDYKGATATAEEALQTAPGSASWASARLGYADALVRTGPDMLEKAVAEYEAVITLSQNDADVARARKTVLALKKQIK